MPLSQMFDKVFGMIKSDMYATKLQEKDALGVRYQCGKHSVNLRENQS